VIDDILARLRQAHDEWRCPNQRPRGPGFSLYERMWNCDACGEPIYEVSRRAGALTVCRNPQCANYASDEYLRAFYPEIGSREYKGTDAMTPRERRRI